MSIVGALVGFGLRQTLNLEGDAVIGFVENWFTDHSQTLPKALGRANDRAWQALAVALAGDGFLDQVTVLFASGDDKGIREQVGRFLGGQSIQFDGTPADFRKTCLSELKQARKAGLLSAKQISPADVTRQTASVQRFADPTGLVHGAWQTTARIADALAPEYEHLAKLLRQPTPGGPPLLVAAFAYFFRREVETDDELANGLMFDGLKQLSAAQAKAFVEVGKALTSLGDQFDRVLEQLDRIETVVVETQAVVGATHGAVLDMQGELHRLGNQHSASVEEMRRLLQETMARVAQLGMQSGEVRPHHSFSIRSEDERQHVKQLLARFRQLPRDQQQQAPALLNGLGKLQIGAGDFDGATQTFTAVAQSTPDASAKAEAHYNAYRAALEKREWDAALAALKEAAALDTARFAPFPLDRYEPQRILGAGGFGTAFLCHDRNFAEDVVVKTLHAADMERSMSEVFQEARILRKLSHAAIIGVHECAFADPSTKTRPYIVMDYFPGVSLEAFVRERGALSTDAFLAVGRQLAAGMQAAHALGVLHRDLKPENVLVRKEGEQWRVKIIDFGLALRKQTIQTSMAAGSTGKTVLGASVVGTLKYAPPEQKGELPGVEPGPYSDVYSFGKLCCFGLFKTTEPKMKHWEGIPRGLADFLGSCLEEQPAARPASFAAVLERLAGPATNRPIPSPTDSVRSATTPELAPSAVSTFDGRNSIGMRFVKIPAGTFTMGSPVTEKERGSDETPQSVTISKPFHLGVFAVTQEEYEKVMKTNPSEFKHMPRQDTRRFPVENVSWDDAQEFCKKLSALPEEKKAGRVYRLPTEAEWEYACRAGTVTPFHFGKECNGKQANCDGNHPYGTAEKGSFLQRTCPVGEYPPNAFGLHDMHGNVWEWCADWYGHYPNTAVTDPPGPKAGDRRVLRGGSWYYIPVDCRAAYRYGAAPGNRSIYLGFRVAVRLD